MDTPNTLTPAATPPTPGLLASWVVHLLPDNAREAAQRARATIGDRQYHVDQGNRYAELLGQADLEYLTLSQERSDSITRPHWLRAWLHGLLKLLLMVAEVAAGTSALVVGGDEPTLSLAAFTGVSVATVLAGTNIGIQVRRRETRLKGGLIRTSVASITLATVLLWTYRQLTLGPRFGILAFVTTMVASGSVFLGYLWHDQASDDVQRARDTCRWLRRLVRREHRHRSVRAFERADGCLRLALVDAVHLVERELCRRPSPFTPGPGSRRPPLGGLNGSGGLVGPGGSDGLGGPGGSGGLVGPGGSYEAGGSGGSRGAGGLGGPGGAGEVSGSGGLGGRGGADGGPEWIATVLPLAGRSPAEAIEWAGMGQAGRDDGAPTVPGASPDLTLLEWALVLAVGPDVLRLIPKATGGHGS